MKLRVIGPLPVDGKSAGEVVDLDPEQVNVEALIQAGHVEQVTAPAKKSSSKGD